MKLLAVSGKKRSGKDTLALHLINNLNAKKVSFADPLKDKVAKDFDIPRDWCDNPEFKEKAILSLPVHPQDNFSRNVVGFMFKEFRGRRGLIADKFDSAYNIGSNGHSSFTLYHTPRSLCILEGSTKRSVDAAYWVKQAIKAVKESSAELLVIPDLRYKSEAKQLKEAFGDDLVLVRVNRPNTLTSQDPSEVDLDDYEGFDFVIENNGTLEEYYNKINELTNKVLK